MMRPVSCGTIDREATNSTVSKRGGGGWDLFRLLLPDTFIVLVAT
jgi:hypothetical protein